MIRLRAHCPPLPRPALVCLLPLWLGAGAACGAWAADAADLDKAAKSARAVSGAEPRSTSAPATAAIDPLEHLRQRLVEKLAQGRPGSGGGPYDLRVSAKTPAAKATSAAGSASAALVAKPSHPPDRHVAGKAARHDEPAHLAHWDYQGPGGPASWGGLKPEYALCSSGQRQSPIDIRGGLAVDLPPVRFNYQASSFAVLDNGHTVQVNVAPGNTIDVGGRRFALQQFHFHRPSEERIDGRQFEMSLHLVHKDAQGRLVVVALLFEPGPAQPVLQQVWNNLPLERNEEAAAQVALELGDLLPADRRYYTYMGSLTTPPCSEGVQWIVMRQPVTLTPQQLDIFARIYPMNARPVQAASGRRIMQSN